MMRRMKRPDKFWEMRSDEGDEIERILSLVPVPSVYINKCDQPCSPFLLVSVPTVLQSIQIDCDSCRL